MTLSYGMPVAPTWKGMSWKGMERKLFKARSSSYYSYTDAIIILTDTVTSCCLIISEYEGRKSSRPAYT